MNSLQKWLIVLASLIFAVGVFLHAFTGRYRLPILEDDYFKGAEHAMNYYGARYDTWTGTLEATQLKPATNIWGKWMGEYKLHWVETPTCWVKDLK